MQSKQKPNTFSSTSSKLPSAALSSTALPCVRTLSQLQQSLTVTHLGGGEK